MGLEPITRLRPTMKPFIVTNHLQSWSVTIRLPPLCNSGAPPIELQDYFCGPGRIRTYFISIFHTVTNSHQLKPNQLQAHFSSSYRIRTCILALEERCPVPLNEGAKFLLKQKTLSFQTEGFDYPLLICYSYSIQITNPLDMTKPSELLIHNVLFTTVSVFMFIFKFIVLIVVIYKKLLISFEFFVIILYKFR